ASDATLTGGAPGIIAYGTGSVASWSGGNAGFEVTRIGTASGITSYNVVSADNGYGPQMFRVLQPTNPAPGVAHNFLIVLPVEAGLNSTFGDGLATMQALDAQDQYNLTIIEPTFNVPPWYANSATDAYRQYESFMTDELVPWIRQNLSTTGHEQMWLIGFSKSGVGAEDLILKHPDLFTLAAAWDFPADISSYDEYSDSSVSYGTDANFQANYRLTEAFIQAHAAPFEASNRIWIGGYSLYQPDVSDYDAELTSAGVLHTMGAPQYLAAHTWNAGWVPAALAGLYTDSLNLPSEP
ncbi:MAG: alpha/beta hydrolase-fold protein, partial [Streptosporangiaceae bacterium]